MTKQANGNSSLSQNLALPQKTCYVSRPMTTTPTLSQLQRGLAISEQIAALETELAAIFNGSAPTKATPTAKSPAAQADGRKGKRSAATIAKMKASQQARWAKVKGKKPAVASKAPAKAKAETPVKKKRTMSPEAKAKIGEAMKARWAAKKAQADASTAKKK